MAKIQNNTYQTKPKSSCFLGCFGFPGEVSKKKSLQETVGSGGRKKTRWISWSRFRMKKSGTKTVPVDVTVSEKAGRNNEIRVSKSDKLTSRCQISDTSHQPMSQIPAVVPVASNEITLIEKPRKTRYGTAQSINLENRKQLDHLDSPKKDTCQKRLSLSRKTEVKRTQDSNSGSPENEPMTGRTAVMSHSASFPPPKRSKQAPNAAGHSQVDVEKLHRKNDTLTGKFNPIIGMSIIMVTLIIMLFWGRLCAILCTSAWFYFVPGLRTAVKSDEIVENNLNSEEYKKKVVLEGFLERNRRNSFGNL